VATLAADSPSNAPNVAPSLETGSETFATASEELERASEPQTQAALQKTRVEIVKQRLLIGRNYVRSMIVWLDENTEPLRKELADVGEESWKEIKENIPKEAGKLPRLAMLATIVTLCKPLVAGTLITALYGGDVAKRVKKLTKSAFSDDDIEDDDKDPG